MRRTIFAAAAVAAVIAIGARSEKAAAMSAATPTELGHSSADAGLVQKAAIVCGYWGCRRVWPGYWGPRPYWGYYHPYYGPYWGWHHPYWGWHRWRRW